MLKESQQATFLIIKTSIRCLDDFGGMLSSYCHIFFLSTTDYQISVVYHLYTLIIILTDRM